jgi:hypothetical protein
MDEPTPTPSAVPAYPFLGIINSQRLEDALPPLKDAAWEAFEHYISVHNRGREGRSHAYGAPLRLEAFDAAFVSLDARLLVFTGFSSVLGDGEEYREELPLDCLWDREVWVQWERAAAEREAVQARAQAAFLTRQEAHEKAELARLQAKYDAMGREGL